MRLTSQEVAAIKSAAVETFGSTAVVRLFGSRVDDARLGGDVDLLIEIDGAMPDYIVHSRFLDLIEPAIDEKKVDVLFTARGKPLTAFERIAYRDGVAL